MNETDIVEVYCAPNTVEAYALKNVLEDAGIRTRVVGDMLQAATGDLPLGFDSQPRLWVARSDETRAKQLLDECEQSHQIAQDGVAAATWRCAHCGEEVESDFEVCWNCEQPR